MKVKLTEKIKQQKMRDWRDQHSFTQVNGAKRLGRNYYSWKDYERGHRKVPESLLVHMADYTALQKMIGGG